MQIAHQLQTLISFTWENCNLHVICGQKLLLAFFWQLQKSLIQHIISKYLSAFQN